MVRNEVTFRYVDQTLNGRLADDLKTMRNLQQSYMAISLALRSRGFYVTAETVRGWCIDLGYDTPMRTTVACLSRPE